MAAPLPPHEPERLTALHSCSILDTPPDEDFDRLTRLARRLAGTDFALVSLVDEARQWFKSEQGLGQRETPREVAFCAHAILTAEPLVVEDTLQDARFSANPLVTDWPFIRFYAGVPLQSDEGYLLGTLCVLDPSPRTLAPARLQALQDLAGQVESLLSHRRRIANLENETARHQAPLPAPRSDAHWLAHASLVDPALDVVSIFEPDGTTRFVSPSIEQVLGYSPDERMGQDPFELVHPDDREQARRKFQAIAGTPGASERLEHRYQHRDGTWRVLEAYAMNLENDPRVGGIYVHSRDVTQRAWTEKWLREQQTQLSQLARELQQIQTQKDELAGLLVHDLKSPVAAVLANAQYVLAEETLTDEGHEAVQDIQSSARVLQRMTLDLLDVSRGEDGRLEAQARQVQLPPLLEEVRRHTFRRASDRGLEIELDCDEAPKHACVDRELMRRTLENLVDNAVKYGRGASRIGISAHVGTASELELRVWDDGPGMEDSVREHIFDKYARLGGGPQSQQRTSRGLGLVFCRMAAEAHGGRIWAEGREPKGSRFRVWLPNASAGAAKAS
jgi:PAS domain S-box-containing protein